MKFTVSNIAPVAVLNHENDSLAEAPITNNTHE